MLQIKGISKQYQTGALIQQALNDVSLNLRDNEFVSILGHSGSGKTTLLNIIGGLDRYDNGELIINGISTKEYKDRDFDAYRNHTVGFVFQSYNLISHQTILSNVELALTISGICKNERRERAKKVLEEVGLGEQLYKKPNQLSGGQMQRVAIARALVNDPEVLLADEPTGALDSETSIQIMELLKKVSETKLVVMVTHNSELAMQYSTRIVKLHDGRIIDDSDPFFPEKTESKTAKTGLKVKMSFTAAVLLSLNNLREKKGRTILITLAASIGIIGIALILSLSSGVNSYIDSMQQDTMAAYPLVLSERTADTTSLMERTLSVQEKENTMVQKNQNEGYVYVDDSLIENVLSFSSAKNNLKAFKRYLEKENNEISLLTDNIVYGYDIEFVVYSYDREGKLVRSDADIAEISDDMDISEDMVQGAAGPAANMERMSSMLEGNGNKTSHFSELLPDSDGGLINSQIKENYELVYGNWATDYDEVLLVLDRDYSVDLETLYQLGLISEGETLKRIDAIRNNQEKETLADTYEAVCEHQFFMTLGNNEFSEKDCIPLSISGIIRPKEGAGNLSISTTVVYTSALTERLIGLTGTNREKPSSISLYAGNFQDKQKMIEAIDDYNFHVSRRNRITYTDYAELLTDTVSSMVNVVSYALIAFVAISLIVSSIMIAIITHISVMERTKEIGILRTLGASKINVSQIFNAENLLIGLCAGVLGIGISQMMSVPINRVVCNALELNGVHIALPLPQAVCLILLSICITMIAGLIPSLRAAKQEPAVVLRSE